MKKSKFIINTLVFILSSNFLIAQESAITEKINNWKNTVKLVLNAGVAVFAIVGGFLIFIQYMQGDQSAQKNFIRFIIGLAIFGLVDLIANVFL